ncbi:MAG: LysR family transcriptional regulator [Bdellovibrionales bacterium]|nr:LysR family transcriptional regulator [Bdellovibrionales bacterium]NQZ19126.1 LysR family transcriptional regulator [Bdellovibrionales bacterium]
MNFQQLTTFCTVLSEGSMTAAAEKLFLTQPAVSQQIRNLEEELNVELLVRGSRQAKATAQGQILYDYAKRIIALNQQAQVAIQTIGEAIQGTLRIGTLNSLGLYIISPVVGLFLKHNSKLNIKLNYEDGLTLVDQFQKGQLDVIILPDARAEYEKPLENVDKKLLLKDEMWLVGSSKDTNTPTEIQLKDIGSKPVVRLSEKFPSFQNALNQKLSESGADLTPVFETTNVGTIKRVIESGLGWGFLPAHSIRKHVRTGRMSVVQIVDFQYPMNVQFYSKKNCDEHEARVYDVFYRALVQQIQNKSI